ncbi:hypothetical protein INT43_008442 [Umbelopsis isabellina]|uniref:DUF4097 domain-containing protein n=1 Tax=Mortierella isabellina TaxID=91625 RepID=A0A8H7UIA6_MORIS|nr:hypothetical protein INT43_008442 [Umbelopsis isabellina]
MDEKSPMLPQPATSGCNCRDEYRKEKRRNWKRKVLVILFSLFFWFGFAAPALKHSANFIQSHFNSGCQNRSLIPWKGKSSFEINPHDFSGLYVAQNGSITQGHVEIFRESNDEIAHVDVDISMSDHHLQDQIEIVLNDNNGLYTVDIRTPRRLHDECIRVDITISLPKSHNFDNFKVSTVNSAITAEADIAVKDTIELHTVNGAIRLATVKAETLKLVTVNGATHVQLFEGKTSNITGTNGSVHAALDAQVVDTIASNGAVQVDLLSHEVKANIKTVNGAIHVKTSGEFEGAFKLKSLSGRLEVTASESKKLHIEKASRREVQGYYGDSNGNSQVNAETVNGKVVLQID